MVFKDYHDARFSSNILREACNKFFEICGKTVIPSALQLTVNKIKKEYSSLEDLLSNYEESSGAFIAITIDTSNFFIEYSNNSYKLTIFLKENSRKKEITQIFDAVFLSSRIDTYNLKKLSVEKTKTYYLIKFPAPTIQEAYRKLASFVNSNTKQDPPSTLGIYHKDERWDYSSYDEFFAEYNNAESYSINHYLASGFTYHISGNKAHVEISIRASSSEQVQSVFQIFERDLTKNILKIDTKALQIFVGHGQSSQWKDLKDHLHEKHGLDVIAYELGTRAGYSIQEVLKDMLDESSLALIVLTGEDLDNHGKYHARENVIHELGLFQGRLGFKRAIALKEEGVTEFSNIQGLNQIRFSKGIIKETFGDVLAIIKEEYSRKD